MQTQSKDHFLGSYDRKLTAPSLSQSIFFELFSASKRSAHPTTTLSISIPCNSMRYLPTGIKWLLSLGGAPARQFGSPGIYTGKSPTIMTWPHSNVLRWRWLHARYVAIKVNANNYMSKENAEQELRITQRITGANPDHEGRYFVRTLLDSSTYKGHMVTIFAWCLTLFISLYGC